MKYTAKHGAMYKNNNLMSAADIFKDFEEKDTRIAELEANQFECLDMLNNFHKNTGSLGAKALVEKIAKQAGQS